MRSKMVLAALLLLAVSLPLYGELAIQPVFVMRLTDGSRLRVMPESQSFYVTLNYGGEVPVPWQHVDGIEVSGVPNAYTLRMNNGDRLSVQPHSENIQIQSTLGSFAVPLQAISQLTRVGNMGSDGLLMEALLILANDTLYTMRLDGSDLKVVAKGLPVSVRICQHPANGNLYLIHWENSPYISVFDPTGSQRIETITGPAGGGQGFAIDPETGTLYGGLYYHGVFKQETDSQNWQTIVASRQLAPAHGQRGQLALDAVNGHLYFRVAFNGPCGSCRYIWRVDLDGGNLMRIVEANDGDALAIAPLEGVMYYSDVEADRTDRDSTRNTLRRARLDGTDVTLLWTAEPPFTHITSCDYNEQDGFLYLILHDHKAPLRRRIARIRTEGTDFQVLHTFDVSGVSRLMVSALLTTSQAR